MSDDTEAGRFDPAPDPSDDAVGESMHENPADSVRDPATGSTPFESGQSDGGVSMVKSGSSPVEAVLRDNAEDLDIADYAVDGQVRESALVGAASAGSARAAARRSGVRAGSSPVKGTPTRSRDVSPEKQLSLVARLRRFLREVVAELRKVIWPARNQMITYTIVVIVFVVFMVALTAGLDVLFAKIVLGIFG